MLNLYLLRHGETEWNVAEKFQGQLNSPLTEKGVEKLEETAEKLKKVVFKSVYTSQMERTIESAKIVLKYNDAENSGETKNRLQNMRELNEIYFGVWQGMTFEEIFKQYPEEGENYFSNPKEFKAWVIGGEDLKEGLDRFLEGLKKISNFEKDGNILVVTHGTVLELFFNYIKGRGIEDLDERELIGNGEYKIFTYENEKFKEV